MKLIHTDNFNGDYPDEKFVTGLNSLLTRNQLQDIADICNSGDPNKPRYWKVVPDDYVLQPGFEP
jgi:hypothetical protein